MNEEFTMQILNNFGFPVLISIVLIWDKIKQNGFLKQAVENNTRILERIERRL